MRGFQPFPFTRNTLPATRWKLLIEGNAQPLLCTVELVTMVRINPNSCLTKFFHQVDFIYSVDDNQAPHSSICCTASGFIRILVSHRNRSYYTIFAGVDLIHDTLFVFTNERRLTLVEEHNISLLDILVVSEPFRSRH